MTGKDTRAVLLQRFADAGLVPVVSTNGGILHADIQVVITPSDHETAREERGRILDVWLTATGEARLHAGR